MGPSITWWVLQHQGPQNGASSLIEHFLEKSISSIFRLRETFTYWMTNVGQRVETPKQKPHPHYSAYRVEHLPTPMPIGPEQEPQLVGIILEDVTLVQDSRVAF